MEAMHSVQLLTRKNACTKFGSLVFAQGGANEGIHLGIKIIAPPVVPKNLILAMQEYT